MKLELIATQCAWCGAWLPGSEKRQIRIPFPLVITASLYVRRPGPWHADVVRLGISHGICFKCSKTIYAKGGRNEREAGDATATEITGG